MTAAVVYRPSDDELSRSKAATAPSWQLLSGLKKKTLSNETLIDYLTRRPEREIEVSPLEPSSLKQYLLTLVSANFLLNDRRLAASLLTHTNTYMPGRLHRLTIPDTDFPQSHSTPWGGRFSVVIGNLEQLRSSSDCQSALSKQTLDQAVFDAKRFVAKLTADLPEPRVSADEDGAVALEWRHRDFRAIVGFEGDGEFGYTMRSPDGEFVPGAEEGRLDTPHIPNDLRNYLLQIQQAKSFDLKS